MKKHRFVVTLVRPDRDSTPDLAQALEELICRTDIVNDIECQVSVELVDTTENLFPDINWDGGDADRMSEEWMAEADRFLRVKWIGFTIKT